MIQVIYLFKDAPAQVRRVFSILSAINMDKYYRANYPNYVLAKMDVL